MRCFITHNNLFYELYWIKYGKNQVIGNFYGNYFDHQLGFPIETHFNYPLDGKIHYSHKSREKNCYITAFHDKVKIKQLIDGVPQKDHIHEKTVFNCLLPEKELQLPLSHYDQPGTFFHFATIGFSVPISDDASVLKYCRKQTKQPERKKDLVISANCLDSGTLNIMAFIASEDYPQPALNSKNQWQVVEKKGAQMIGISAIHCKNTH